MEWKIKLIKLSKGKQKMQGIGAGGGRKSIEMISSIKRMQIFHQKIQKKLY